LSQEKIGLTRGRLARPQKKSCQTDQLVKPKVSEKGKREEQRRKKKAPT